uniref:Uncharacterized protein n=1 Tax=Oryza sativa subsp. japonica TaxID=39947 RepID=Q84M65_ORYSJ|nr:hypothetical protein [Oryza sativa Japonica Group]
MGEHGMRAACGEPAEWVAKLDPHLCPWLLRLSATPVDRSPPRSPAPTPADGSEAAGRADVRGAEATVAALTGDQALYNGFGAAGMHGAAVMQPPTFGQE